MFNQSNRAGFSSSSRPAGASSRGRGRRDLAPRDSNGPSDFQAQPPRRANDFGDRQFQQRHEEPNESLFTSTGFDQQPPRNNFTRNNNTFSGSSNPRQGQSQRATFKAREIPHYETPTDGDFESFADLIDPQTIENLEAHSITSLFPIQRDCFHPIYHGANVIGRELTGCGKTLAFALPLVTQLRDSGKLGSGVTQAIILAPTRELALQVEKTFDMLKHSRTEFQTLTVYGGVSLDDQTRKLRHGVDIFVGTTGRVLDHIRRGNIDFTHLKAVVLDEADMMLDMGFKDDIDEVLYQVSVASKNTQNELQICLFSATVPDWVKKVAREYMNDDFIMVDLAQDLQNKTAKNVKHLAIFCQGPRDQLKALNAVLTAATGGQKYLPKSIVFTQTKVEADKLCQVGGGMKGGIGVMHGDVSQAMRERTINAFKQDVLRVLVATDVASRGLDIPNVDLIVQFNPPKNTETYIHRSGRTARAGASGTCVTFYNGSQFHMVEQIVRESGINLEQVENLSKLDLTPVNSEVAESATRPQKRQTANIKVAAAKTAPKIPQEPRRPNPTRTQAPMRSEVQHTKDCMPVTQEPTVAEDSEMLSQYSKEVSSLLAQNRQDQVVSKLLAFIESQGLSVEDALSYCQEQDSAAENPKSRSRMRQRTREIDDEDKENVPLHNLQDDIEDDNSSQHEAPQESKDVDLAEADDKIDTIDPEKHDEEDFFDCTDNVKGKSHTQVCEEVLTEQQVIDLDDQDEPEDYLDEEELEAQNSELLLVD